MTGKIGRLTALRRRREITNGSREEKDGTAAGQRANKCAKQARKYTLRLFAVITRILCSIIWLALYLYIYDALLCRI